METRFWEQGDKGNLKGVRPAKDETRTELFEMFICDLSGSMGGPTRVVSETGEEKMIPKIDQLNEGFKAAHKSMLRFMEENTRFYVKYQLVELNTYCKALFNTYKNIDDTTYNLSEVTFTADGVTNIEATFNTAIQFINKKHLGNYNRALNIIMMSDGVPTDVNGFALSEAKWKKIVDKFKGYLADHDYLRSVAFYFIAIGDEAEPFGRYWAGDEHFYKVEDCESLKDKIDFVTRQTLADSTTATTPNINFSDDDSDKEGSLTGDSDTDALLKTVIDAQADEGDGTDSTADYSNSTTLTSSEDVADDDIDLYALISDDDDVINAADDNSTTEDSTDSDDGDDDDGDDGDGGDAVEKTMDAGESISGEKDLSDLLTF